MKKTALILAPPFWPNLPPLSLINLGSYLLENNLEVDLFDLNNFFFNLADEQLKKSWRISCNIALEKAMAKMLEQKWGSELKAKIEALTDYERIGFSCYRSNIKTTLALAQAIKKKNTNIKFIFGGPEIVRLYFKSKANFNPELNRLADLIVVGEGEKPLLEFIQGKTKDKVILFEELEDLDIYNPRFGYKKIDINAYPKKRAVSLLFGRGCPRQCRFCSERLLYKRFRTRSIQNIITEIRFYENVNKIQCFIFHDSMLNADLSALEKLCDAIIKNFGKINWEAQMSIKTDMPDELFHKIKQSGCYNLFIGLESGSDRTLKRMRKGFTAKEAVEFFKKLKNAELRFGISLISGFPGETEEEQEESLRFIINHKDLIPKIEQVNPFVYYDGTAVDGCLDYRNNKRMLEQTGYFVSKLKEHKFKMTNAFVNNLIEK